MDLPRAARRLSVPRLVLGPGLAAVVLALDPGERVETARMAAVAAWMAAWWISEAVPIAVTALLPLVLLPMGRISPVSEVALSYGRSTLFLFLGGFLIALALETSGLHRRLALAIVRKVGSRPSRLVFGFMLATWLLSMWLSNTSTTMLMLPIVLSVLATAREKEATDGPAGSDTPRDESAKLSVAMLLGIAYAANMGGMATLVGTPPNLAFSRLFVQLFDGAPAVTFAQWMLLALPFSLTFLVTGWLLLTRVVTRLPRHELMGGRAAIEDQWRQLGPLRRDELLSGGVFAATAALWISGAGIDLGGVSLPGWREALGVTGYVDDAVVAVAMAVLLFMLPSADRPGEALLEWSMTRELPWGMLLLFGGGFALAAGFQSSGLSQWAGGNFAVLGGSHPWLVVALVCLLVTYLTELTSNIATAEMLLPILATAAVTLGLDPRALMIPATLSASCAFMMPVATPPAAIVYGTGLVPIRSMVRAGMLFNLLGIALVMGTMAALAGPILGIDIDQLPAWVRP